MIILHILAYVLVIIANILELLLADLNFGVNLKLFEFTSVSYLVIYFFCNLILGLIVN
jgi:hypothetical protein